MRLSMFATAAEGDFILEESLFRFNCREQKTSATFTNYQTLFGELFFQTTIGFNFEGIFTVILTLKPKDFHKSMTTNSDHKIWQDVYRPVTTAGEVYLKLTVIDDVLIVSFKEL